jgi:NADPH-dependent curcumin reductase CurA
MSQAQQVKLKSFPKDKPVPSDFDIVDVPMPEAGPGEALIATEHLGIDAWITTTLGGGGLHTNIPLGSVIPALGVGRVVASTVDGLKEGQAVFGPLGAQSHGAHPAAALQPIDDSAIPARSYLGALGLTTGLTAWVGLIPVGELKEGDTAVISAAAGSVGSFATEIARLRGAKVIGIAGGPDKVKYVTDTLGADAAIDYRNDNVAERLAELAPNGVNLFFDNVGGEILDAVLDNLAQGARVVICGAISQYPDVTNVQGPSLYLRLAERNSSMRGFVVSAWAEHFPKATAEITGWIKNGDFHVPEQIESGLANFPAALGQLFTGHVGKLMVEI